MTNTEQEPGVPADASVIHALAAAANLNISPERLPEIIARYRELLAQLREIDQLDLREIVPVSGFDPTWEPAS